MLTKQDIIAEARRLKFADIGFTSAEPFASQKEYLLAHQEEIVLGYGPAMAPHGVRQRGNPRHERVLVRE